MQADRMHVTVPENRRAIVEFPETVPTGEVELIVLVSAEKEAEPAPLPLLHNPVPVEGIDLDGTSRLWDLE